MLKFLFLITSLNFFVQFEINSETNSYQLSACQSQLYCEGPFLETVQLSGMFPKSKTFVDMTTRETNDEVTVKWQKLFKGLDDNKSPPTGAVKGFVLSNFAQENQGVTNWQPEDFNNDPWFIDYIQDVEMKQFARYLIGLYRSLGRKINDQNVERHSSLLYVPNGYFVTSGGVNELEYWSSYWVIQGLLLCEMDKTAKGIIDNFIHLIKQFGFIPGKNRLYHASRSQPPLLTFMVWDYLLKTRDFNWLKTIIKYLDLELQWWVENKLTKVNIDGLRLSMARYVSESRGPRPEMYKEDYELVKNEDEEIQQDIFNDIKAADESGWGLSSRWMIDNLSKSNNSQIYDINFIRASSISPVDLNSYLYGAFLRLSSMYLILEDLEKRSYWYELARDMKKTIQLVLWDEKDGIWYDYNLDSQEPIKKYSASNLTPLWVEAYNDTLCLKAKQAFRAASYLVRLGINKFEGGIPVTLEDTGEKWDFPNAFAPIQSMIVQGLARSGSEAAEFLAEQFARDWIKVNMISWKQRGVLFDYYDSERQGKTKRGVDKKFGEVNGGWSSGVLLEFINTYYVMMNKNSSFMIVT